jgi:hypothetical protein
MHMNLLMNSHQPVKAKDLMPWGTKGWMTICMTIKPKWKPKAVRVTRVGYSKDHSSNTYVVLKHDSNKYVKSRDIKWDEPRRYRKLTLEAKRDPSKTAITPEWEQTIAEANRFASIISDEDDDDDSDDGEDSLSGNDTTAVAHDDQQQGGRLQHEINRLAPHNNPGTGTVEGGLIGRTASYWRHGE